MMIAECPQCDASAQGRESVGNLFGWKTAEHIVPQSWCKKCSRKFSKNHGKSAMRNQVHALAEELTFGIEVEWTGGLWYYEAAGMVAREMERLGYAVRLTSSRRITLETSRGWQDFKFVSDASVAHGGEMVSPPITISDIDIVQDMVRSMRAAGCRVNSTQAGVHVHVGAQNLTIDQVKNIARYGMRWEDHLLAVSNVAAARQRWCRPMKKEFVAELEKKSSGWTREELDDAWYTTNPDPCRDRTAKYHGSRYTAVNLHALFTIGTLEFRVFNGTLHAGKIRSYIRLALHMVARGAVGCQASSKRKKFDTSNPEKSAAAMFRFLHLHGGDEFNSPRKHLTENAIASVA